MNIYKISKGDVLKGKFSASPFSCIVLQHELLAFDNVLLCLVVQSKKLYNFLNLRWTLFSHNIYRKHRYGLSTVYLAPNTEWRAGMSNWVGTQVH